MRSSLSLLSLLMLTAFACQRESESIEPSTSTTPAALPQEPVLAPPATAIFRLKQTVVTGNTSGLGPSYQTIRFNYLQGRALRQAFIPPNSPNPSESPNEYSYDEQGRVSFYLVRYAQPKSDGNTGERHTFTYGQTSFEYAFQRIGADGQGLPNQVNTERNIYRTNPDGQLTQWLQEGIIRYDRPTRARYEYSYENGNIVKADYINGDEQIEFTIRYQYDDKVNPYYEWMFTIDPVQRYSRNNVTSAQVNASTPYKTEYTYNEYGLPLTKKDVANGAVLTYEYEAY